MDKKEGRKEKGGCEKEKLGQERIGSIHEAEGARLKPQGLLRAAFLVPPWVVGEGTSWISGRL